MTSRSTRRARAGPLEPSRPSAVPRLSAEVARREVERWDRMQVRYIPSREERFRVMFDLVEGEVGRAPRVLDIGCGPGSLSRRLLERFPSARSVGVDYDPVLLELGPASFPRAALARMNWVEADLRDPEWARALPPGRFDAALSTTALHWLPPRELARLYADLHRRLRPGGVLLNGDKAELGPGEPRLESAMSDAMHRRQRSNALSTGVGPDWRGWWRAISTVPSLRPALEVRRQRFETGNGHEHTVPAAGHVRALRAAGFREADVVWREFTNVVLMAVR